MMYYTVVMDDSFENFLRGVSDLLDGGWELQGGVSVSVTETDDFKYLHYAQALVVTRPAPKQEGS